MGTFVEVECSGNTVIRGESFLTCTESGSWDFAVPQCILPETTTVDPSTSQTALVSSTEPTAFDLTPSSEWTSTTEQSSSSASTNDIASSTATTSDLSSPIPEDEQSFWRNWKRLLLSGCDNFPACECFKNPSWYSDVASFEMPESAEYRHMDVKLWNRLINASQSLQNNVTLRDDINIENLLPFILFTTFDEIPEETPAETVKVNAFRFVVHLYVDTILLSEGKEDIGPVNENDITRKIQKLLKEIVSLAHKNEENFRETCARTDPVSPSTEKTSFNRSQRSTVEVEVFTQLSSTTEMPGTSSVATTTDSMSTSTESTTVTTTTELEATISSSTTTEENVDPVCVYGALPSHDETLFIADVVDPDGSSFDVQFMEEFGALPGTKVGFSCAKGYLCEGPATVECGLDGVWSSLQYHCDRK